MNPIETLLNLEHGICNVIKWIVLLDELMIHFVLRLLNLNSQYKYTDQVNDVSIRSNLCTVVCSIPCVDFAIKLFIFLGFL